MVCKVKRHTHRNDKANTLRIIRLIYCSICTPFHFWRLFFTLYLVNLWPPISLSKMTLDKLLSRCNHFSFGFKCLEGTANLSDAEQRPSSKKLAIPTLILDFPYTGGPRLTPIHLVTIQNCTVTEKSDL